MSTHYHTPISVGSSNHPNTINTPLGQIDQAVHDEVAAVESSLTSQIIALENEIDADITNFQNYVNGNIADLEQTLDEGLGGLSTTLTNSTEALQDQIDALIIDDGTGNAEVIAARNRIRYKTGSPPDVLGDTVELVGRNQIHVEAYGAVGDGSTDDTAAIQAALNAAVAGDVIVFSAGKTYVATTIDAEEDAVLLIPASNVTLLGYGATIDASDLDNSTESGASAPPTACIKADSKDNITIIGLRMIGPDITGSLDVNAPEERQTTGIYLKTCNHCQIRDCRIEGFFRGGIYVLGNYNSISGNHLHRVRYRPAEMGSIFLSANENSTVVGNVITGVWGSGIAAQNSYRCTIQGNIIEGIDWSVETQAQSMGICTYNCSYFSIVGNTIERVTDEGIVMSSGGGASVVATNYNTIVGNTIVNPKLYGICLRAISGSSGFNHYANYNTVSDNIVIANANHPGDGTVIGYYIDSSTVSGNGFNYAIGNKFDGNIVVADGYAITRGVVMTGANITRSVIVNNVCKGCDRGIEILNTHGLVANNAVYESPVFGIYVRASSNYCLVTGNKVTGTPEETPAIKLSGALTGTKIVGNFIDTPIDISDATGNAYFRNRNHREDMVSSGIGTLSSGSAFITGLAPTHCEGAITLIRRTPASTPSNTGILYISNIDQVTFNRATVTSTNAADNGTFYWYLDN